jgi:hypothetical protein
MSNMDCKNTICIEKYSHEKPIDTMHLGISFIKKWNLLSLGQGVGEIQGGGPSEESTRIHKALGGQHPVPPVFPHATVGLGVSTSDSRFLVDPPAPSPPASLGVTARGGEPGPSIGGGCLVVV